MTITTRRRLLLATILILGGAVQGWAAGQWRANFDSDEATMGLMALHTLQGRPPTYFYGQHYGGSLEALLSAMVIRLLGSGIPSLRLSNVVLFVAFLVLSYLFTKSMYGTRIALLTTLLLAFPSWLMLYWTYRPFVGFGVLLTAGTAVFWLAYARTTSRPLHLARLAAIGFLVGLGLWTNPMMIIYVFTLVLTYCSQTPEWAFAAQILARASDRFVGIPFREVVPVGTIGLASIGVLAFFSQGCSPTDSYEVAQYWARLILIGLALVAALLLFRVSERRGKLATTSLLIGIGFIIGNAPQWKAWLLYDVPPSTAILPSCPTDALTRARLLAEELIPTMWGTPGKITALPSWAAPHRLLALSGLLVMAGALLTFIWQNRTGLWSLVSLGVTDREPAKAQIITLWFAVPIGLMLLSSNTINLMSIRYLIISWQSGTIMLAWFLDQLIRRRRQQLVAALLGIWLLQIAVVGYGYLHHLWHHEPNEPKAVAELEEYLAKQNVRGGYADYWSTYTLDYLTQERLIFVPYNGLNRYEPYNAAIGTLNPQAYLLPAGALPEQDTDIGDLRGYIAIDRGAGPAFPYVDTHLAHQSVVSVHRVANWDVWLVTNR